MSLPTEKLYSTYAFVKYASSSFWLKFALGDVAIIKMSRFIVTRLCDLHIPAFIERIADKC